MEIDYPFALRTKQMIETHPGAVCGEGRPDGRQGLPGRSGQLLATVESHDVVGPLGGEGFARERSDAAPSGRLVVSRRRRESGCGGQRRMDPAPRNPGQGVVAAGHDLAQREARQLGRSCEHPPVRPPGP